MDFTNKTDADVAYYILSELGEAIFYKELIMKVIEAKNKPIQSLPAVISEIYTMINMDSRFHHIGGGMWELTEWVPQDAKSMSASSASAANSK
ncbi:DNA-directed RNA polymerase subunit delta [Pectinatus cerevisiiphilus]|uniref:RNAP delta factor n=1 Tax=Pectinatus cerevisiiphilus TaxID=86956 RepID=A0A4R3K3B2_9FIRM|nr:DNA-directed RNA polymerase subunit delta [Pectinatus cerevisiiphilus]TCS77153.1 DNA-directed RNA polymerase subunit delta [Pectinatus cerevisiiphilus]